MDWISPHALTSGLECALMTAKYAKEIGNIGEMGRLRHKAIEYFLLGKEQSLTAAAQVAAMDFRLRPGEIKLSEGEIAQAVDQVKKFSTRHLPDRNMILSVEGRGLPDEWTQVKYGKKMLAIPIRTEAGEWGEPYGIRMIVDCIWIDDANGGLFRITDWKGASPGEDNAIQATLNFVAAWHLIKRWKLSYAAVRWQAVAVPSGLTDTYDFAIDSIDQYLSWLDDAVRAHRERIASLVPTPGKHCDSCKLFGSSECSATSSKSLITRADEEMVTGSFDGIDSWTNDELTQVFERAKQLKPFAEAIVDKTKAEVRRRVGEGQSFGPDGQVYEVVMQGTSQINYDLDAMIALVCEVFGIDPADVKIPHQLRVLLGVVGKKDEIQRYLIRSESRVKNVVERLAGCYTQGKSAQVKLKKVVGEIEGGKPE